ncbi:hypothetical protein DL93DRAFT_2174520 [Clavulina sp. PMI_390]|nr:hypothetical protein DL93DRAFT_2174520 [Clavulina sp. PMI_390]
MSTKVNTCHVVIPGGRRQFPSKTDLVLMLTLLPHLFSQTTPSHVAARKKSTDHIEQKESAKKSRNKKRCVARQLSVGTLASEEMGKYYTYSSSYPPAQLPSGGPSTASSRAPVLPYPITAGPLPTRPRDRFIVLTLRLFQAIAFLVVIGFLIPEDWPYRAKALFLTPPLDR